jgi:DNA-binding transcriptional LysR family regulator
MKNLTLRQPRAFDAAATTLSHSRAAEQLHLTQPAVSMQIRLLEDELGLPLFRKQGRGLQLTEAGDELLRHARGILGAIRQAEEALTSMSSGEGSTRGQLHLGVVPTANYFAPLLMMAFRERFPEVKLKLSVDRRETILALLNEHQIDVAIAGYPPSEADVEAEAFARHPHCIVAAPAHPLAGKRRIAWSELKGEPFIFREPGSATRQFLEHLLQSQSLQVNVTMELSGNETIKQAVMAGMGISFMSAHAFQIELAAGRMAVLDLVGMPKLLDWCLLHRRDGVLTGVNAAFREFVLEQGARLAHCEMKRG